MEEISLNILDIAQNSVKADASLIEITVDEDVRANTLSVTIKDNGCGMDEETLKNVSSPFYTTRTTRRVGLGIPMFKMAAEMTGGSFEITSEKNIGTTVKAVFVYNSIDRMPLGNIADTVVSLVQCNAQIDFVYRHVFNSSSFVLDTRDVKQTLGGVPIDNVSVLGFIREYIVENYAEIKKGVTQDEKS